MNFENLVSEADLDRDAQAVEGHSEKYVDGREVFVLAERGEWNRWIEAERPVDLENWR